MPSRIVAAALVALAASAAQASALTPPTGFEAAYGAVYNPVTDTTYLAVHQTDELDTFQDAWIAINDMHASGGPQGWLATIYTAQENGFLVEAYAARGLDLWGYRMGATRSAAHDSFGNVIPDVSGPWYWNANANEPMVYTNWAAGQPDNFKGAEYLGIYDHGGRWNDTQIGDGWDRDTGIHHHLGFVAEFAGNQVSAVPEPGSCALLCLGLGVLAVRARASGRR